MTESLPAAHGHDHGLSADADRRSLGIALGLIVGFLALEVATAFAALGMVGFEVKHNVNFGPSCGCGAKEWSAETRAKRSR